MAEHMCDWPKVSISGGRAGLAGKLAFQGVASAERGATVDPTAEMRVQTESKSGCASRSGADGSALTYFNYREVTCALDNCQA